jgi:hypothetical protein
MTDSKSKPAEGDGGLGQGSSEQTEPRQHTPPKQGVQAAASRRLIGSRYSPALPQTAFAFALLDALRRRAGAS